MENFTHEQCGPFYTTYNNFFITKVAFWQRRDVQQFLQHVDASHTIYYNRWGDALWHSIALQLFLDPGRVHVFQDWSYEHISRKRLTYRGKPTACLHYGGVAVGTGLDAVSEEVLRRVRVMDAGRPCSRARHDINRCYYSRRQDGRLLGVFMGDPPTTTEEPTVTESDCRRAHSWRWLAACNSENKESKPTAHFCRAKALVRNSSVDALFPGALHDSRLFSKLERGVAGQIMGARGQKW